MKTIYFVTGNKGKVLSLQNRLPAGLNVEQLQIDVPELQHSEVEEIVRGKARYAFEKTGKPLVMQDSAFKIEALNGFPGPYIKYVNQTIGALGIYKLMEGVENRRAYFEMALAFVNNHGNVYTFKNDISKGGGVIADHVASSNSQKSWSDIWRVYSPRWANGKTLSELTSDEIDSHEKNIDTSSEFYFFSQWISKNYK